MGQQSVIQGRPGAPACGRWTLPFLNSAARPAVWLLLPVLTVLVGCGEEPEEQPAEVRPVRTVTALSRTAFAASVYPVLQANCVSCHQPTGNAGASQTGQSFLRNRYVLTGDAGSRSVWS